MSNIEKIRQEIERLINEYKPVVGGVDELTGAHLILAKLLTFIDSLPDEAPSEDLEKVAVKYERENRQSILSSVDIVDAFVAGAEWQKEQMMKEAVDGKVFMSFAPGHNQMVMADVDLPTNTKVKLIIVKQDD